LVLEVIDLLENLKRAFLKNVTFLKNFVLIIKTETMLVTTTPSVEGRKIVKYIGLVTGETIIGANIFKDLFAGITDIVGGRSSSYERVLREGKDTAVNEMQQYAAALGANAIVGVDLDYETVGSGGSMLMVSANGTAVILED
jgi:uncharacterized protein YbjQ (UPF0145 family)